MRSLRSTSPGPSEVLPGLPGVYTVLALSIAGVFALASAARAATLAVPEEYASIQAAIDAAADGDRIEVGDGVYAEAVRIERRTGIDLIAVGAAIIDAAGFEVGVLVRKSHDVRVKGFKILHALDDGIRVAGSTDVAVASSIQPSRSSSAA